MAQTSRKHALIIVDLQKDFCPGARWRYPAADKIVPVIREVLEKNSWDCIVMTQDWHPAGHVSFARNHEAGTCSTSLNFHTACRCSARSLR